MTGEEDPPWETEFENDDDTDKRTVVDQPPLAEAVPAPVPTKDTTGKYKTLPGFSANVKNTDEEVAVTFAQGRIYEAKKIYTALRLLRIGAGDHPDVATATVERLKKWMSENEKLIDEAMRED